MNTDTTITGEDLTITLQVEQSPEEVYEAIYMFGHGGEKALLKI